MIERIIPLPDRIGFDVPRDYAKFCNETIVRVGDAQGPQSSLIVRWNHDVLQFLCGNRFGEYNLASALGLLFNPCEKATGLTFGTLRIIFRPLDGGCSSLPILSSDITDRDRLEAVARRLLQCGLPIPFCWWEGSGTAAGN